MAHEQNDALETKVSNKISVIKCLSQGGHRRRYNDQLPALEYAGLMKETERGVWPLGGPGCAERRARSSFTLRLLGNEGAMHQGWERTRISAEALKDLSDKFDMATAYETLNTRVESELAPIMKTVEF